VVFWHLINNELVLPKDKLNYLLQQVLTFKIYIEFEISMPENLLEFYRKSDGAFKKRECESESEHSHSVLVPGTDNSCNRMKDLMME